MPMDQHLVFSVEQNPDEDLIQRARLTAQMLHDLADQFERGVYVIDAVRFDSPTLGTAEANLHTPVREPGLCKITLAYHLKPVLHEATT